MSRTTERSKLRDDAGISCSGTAGRNRWSGTFGNSMLHSPKLMVALKPRVVASVKKWGLFTAFTAICWSFCGCTAAYNARTVNSPNWKYAATCHIRGSFGRSYLANTKKKIVVTITELSTNAKERGEREIKEALAAGVWRGPDNPGAIVTVTNTLLFRKEYQVKGSDLHWKSEWGKQNNLTIVFYDYGAGVEIPYAAQEVAAKRFLRTMHYEFVPGLGIYNEVASK